MRNQTISHKRRGKQRKIFITEKGWQFSREMETYCYVMPTNYTILKTNSLELAQSMGKIFTVQLPTF